MINNKQNHLPSDCNEEVLLNIDDCAKFLGISRNSLYSKTCKNLIPYYKFGKRILFDKHELYCWITNNYRVKPDIEIEQEVRQQIINKSNTKRR